MHSDDHKQKLLESQLDKELEENGDYYSTPVRAYIIFQDEEGY